MIDIKEMEKDVLSRETNMREGEHSLSYMLIKDIQANARRWFIIAIAELLVIVSIVAGMLWYNSLPAEEYNATIETAGDANAISGIGDNYGNQSQGTNSEEN